MAKRSLVFTLFISTALIVFSCKPEGTDVEKIMDQMSIRQKIDLIGGHNSFHIRAYPELGIPEINMADGPVGVRNLGKSTAYPASITLAAAWDKELSGKVGAAIGKEAKSKNIHIMLGPAMNIHRGPYCGRNFEYLGEDPYLAGEIASSYVLGMQEQGVVATAKHYVANYQDFDRHRVSSDMDERTLHEIYLPAFKACVEKGKAGAIMTSYNLINGIHASQHDYLLNDVLKKQWGFEGIVMSDWTSTYDGVACAIGGLDLEMPAGTYMAYDTLMPAMESGELSETVIDDKVRRILNLYNRFDYFQNPDISLNYQLDEQFARGVALDAARGGITLLKNEGDILPVGNDKPYKIAVIGTNAHPAVTGGGGSSYVQALYPVSLLEAIRQMAGEQTEISFEPALLSGSELPESYYRDSKFYTYVDGQETTGVTAVFFDNMNLEGEPVYTSVFTSLDLTLDDSIFPGLPEVNYSARFETYFKVDKPGNYRISIAGDDGYRVFLNGEKVIEHWQNQSETLRGCDAMLKEGQENKVVVEYYQEGGSASVRLGYNAQINMKSQAEQSWANAQKAAQNSDLVVFAVGFSRHIETEGMDRSWELPAGQDKMIAELSELNSNCVVVLNAGGNVNMPWLNNVKALIHAWYPGQEGNLAVAEILFGITNPSGKLPVSFESREEDNPTHGNYFDEDGDKKVYFSEGIFLGYRHFDKPESIKPRFPFGFGLSYTSFEYSDIQVDKSEFSPGENVQVSFTIKNTGDRAGAEVAQVYVADKESALPRPVKELKGFEKVLIREGEESRVTVMLDPDAFSYYNPDLGGWTAEPGEFEILIGTSSEDIRLKAVVNMLKN